MNFIIINLDLKLLNLKQMLMIKLNLIKDEMKHLQIRQTLSVSHLKKEITIFYNQI